MWTGQIDVKTDVMSVLFNKREFYGIQRVCAVEWIWLKYPLCFIYTNLAVDVGKAYIAEAGSCQWMYLNNLGDSACLFFLCRRPRGWPSLGLTQTPFKPWATRSRASSSPRQPMSTPSLDLMELSRWPDNHNIKNHFIHAMFFYVASHLLILVTSTAQHL